MKQFFLGFMFAILLINLGQALYTYTWWSNEKICRDSNDMTLECINNRTGKIFYIGLITGHIRYSFRQWDWSY